MPSRRAIAHDSAIAAIVAPAMRLLQSFAAWPAPCVPTRTTRPPSVSNSGSARRKAGSAPPTMIVSVASPAPRGPPLTGASSTSSSGHSAASRRASAGGLVDMSTRSVPDVAPSRTPSAPSTTSSTTPGVGSERRTISASSAAAAGVDAEEAPSRPTRAGSTSQPTRSCPAATRWRAIGRPIVPRPITATRVTPASGELAAERAEPRVRPAARRDDDPDHELVRPRCVGDPHLERLVVGADGVVVLVLDGDVERRAGGAALLGRGEERRPLDRVAHLVAEAEVVDHRRAVLHVAVEPDQRALAHSLCRRTEERQRALREQLAEGLAVAVDQRLEIVDESACERVFDDRAGGDHPGRRSDRPPALPLDVLDDRDHLS